MVKKNKKGKIDWKKWGKRWGKTQKWMENNVNPDVLSGHEERIFGWDDYGNPSKKKEK